MSISNKNTSDNIARRECINFVVENKVEGTKRGYGGYAKKYLAFCKSRQLSPVAPSSLCLHLVKEHERGLSRSTLTKTIPSAVGDAFRFGASSPTRSLDGTNVLLKQVKETIKRLTPKSVQKKKASHQGPAP